VGPYTFDDLKPWYYAGDVDGCVQVHSPEEESEWTLLEEAVLQEEEVAGESQVYVLDNETNGKKSLFDCIYTFDL
jgi:hypothetical protein